MQHLTVTSPHHLEWTDAPAPALATETTAIVRPIAVATCDFDHLIVGGATNLALPLAIGHECVAEVVEVGSRVERASPGDRVIVSYQVSCGTCPPCRRGDTSSCEAVPWLSGFGLGATGGDFGGAVGDLLAVPFADAMLVPLPDGVSTVTAAAVGCNLPDAYRCVDPLLDRPGSPVLIAGGAFHSIGMYAIDLALALGASRVDYLDRDPERRAAAATRGAHVIERPEDVPAGAYPVTADASMDVKLLAAVIKGTAPSGTCTVSTMYATGAVPIPLFSMFQHGVTLRTGQPHTRSLMAPVLDLLADGRLDANRIVTEVVPWESAPDVFGRGRGKYVCVRP